MNQDAGSNHCLFGLSWQKVAFREFKESRACLFEALCIDYSLNFWGATVSNLLRSLGFSFFLFFPQGVIIRKAVNEMSMGLSNKQNYLVVEKQGGNNERFF